MARRDMFTGGAMCRLQGREKPARPTAEHMKPAIRACQGVKTYPGATFGQSMVSNSTGAPRPPRLHPKARSDNFIILHNLKNNMP